MGKENYWFFFCFVCFLALLRHYSRFMYYLFEINLA